MTCVDGRVVGPLLNSDVGHQRRKLHCQSGISSSAGRAVLKGALMALDESSIDQAA
jgi:hypothetical protein